MGNHLKAMSNICLFGGTFDPVHEGHILAAQRSVTEFPIDKVIFLPAASSPFKSNRVNLFSDNERLALLKEATKNLPWAEISTVDLEMPQPSYSYRVVELFKKKYPKDNLYWLMGTDQWDKLNDWAHYEYLVENLRFIVQHRTTTPIKREGVEPLLLSGDHPASASAIRDMLRDGKEVPSEWMNEDVYNLAKELLK